MIEFKRYSHVSDLLLYYAKAYNDNSIISILNKGVGSESEAKEFSLFVWRVVDSMHDDCDSEVEVMGSTNNLEMLPDLEYEISLYMRKTGFYEVWKRVSEQA